MTLGVVLSGITLMTAVMTLLGYGQDLGRLDAVGLTPEQLQRTPLDFLLRSKDVVLAMLVFMNKLSTKHVVAMLESWWASAGWAMVVLCAIALFAGYMLTREGRRQAAQVAALLKGNRVTRAVVWFSRRVRLAHAWQVLTVRSRLLCYGLPLGTAALFFAIPLLLAGLLWLSAVVFFVVAGFIPSLPVQTAFASARAEIVEPAACRQPMDPMRAKAGEGAICVRVYRGGCEVGRGRYIEQSASRIWLLHKRPWRVVSIPLDGSLVEDVDLETAPADVKLCGEAQP